MMKKVWLKNKRKNKQEKAVLLIDTTEFNIIRLWLKKNGKLCRFKKLIKTKERDTLLQVVDGWLRKNRVRAKDLSGIVVIKGPGPFTSVRVGVTVANTLGWSLNKPVYGIRKTDSFNPIKILEKIVNKKIKPVKFVKPFYSQQPNITKPKNES